MKKFLISATLSLLALGSLTGCKSTDGQEAYYEDMTADSIFGKLSDFSLADPDNVKSGQTLTFKATPEEHYSIKDVTNNNKPCKLVRKNDDGSAVYKTTIVPGKNVIAGTYSVDKDVDWVDICKIPISNDVFNEIMSKKKTDGKEVFADDTDVDFRKSGIEQVRAPNYYDGDTKKEYPTTGKNSVFINYVDGDTTHVETFNLKYTVKIRYLSIDTPESTSEIEEWGLTASNYSKYIYSGHDEYKQAIRQTTDFTGVQAGATSIILMSQEITKAGEENVKIADLNKGTTKEGKYHATTDGNQRNLAYVWYSTAKNPTKDTFRCLNLEMVYQGFSSGIGSKTDTSLYMYKMLAGAGASAEANKRHMFSDMDDNNYYYYERDDVKIRSATLTEIYEDLEVDNDDPLYYKASTSSLANRRTLFKIEGYVSRMVGTSFYMQEKQTYTKEEWKNHKAVGIYVFTFSQTLIRPGDHVVVIGALSEYGGTLQIQGINFNTIRPNLKRDTRILESDKYVTPVKMTGADFNTYRLPSVLVDIVDDLYFYDFESTYDGVTGSIAEGGSQEVNKYNLFYKFYNTSNAPFFYATFGEDNGADLDNAPSSADPSVKVKETVDGNRYSSALIRFKVDENVLVSYDGKTSYSYRFFVGGSYWYNDKGAQFASATFASTVSEADRETLWTSPSDPSDPESKTWQQKLPDYDLESFKELFIAYEVASSRKCIKKDTVKNHGIICMSTGYESTSGKRKMTATICTAYYTEFTLSEVE